MFRNKFLIITGALVLVASMAITTLAVIGNSRRTGRFANNGYVLYSDENGAVSKAIISKGNKYKSIYPDKVQFEDVQNTNMKVEADSFIYYDNGSIGSFSDGVLLNAKEVGSSYINNYSLPNSTYLEKIEDGYKIQNTSSDINFNDIILKVSDDKYIMVADALFLHLGENTVETIENYIEVEYVDKGVTRIMTKDNVWNTVSSSAKIVLDDGLEFDLADKRLLNTNNDGTLYLANLLVENDDNIDLHYLETMGIGEITIPVFDVETTDGKQGKVGQVGKTGKDGESGAAGAAGKAGVAGAAGASGEDGNTVGQSTIISTIAEPVFTVSEWNTTPEKIDGIISIEDEDFSLLNEETGTIKVTKSGSAIADAIIDDINFSTSVGSGYNFEFDSLEPDQEYEFVVEADYTSADGEEYRRVFLDRTFYTSSLGAFAEPSVVYEDSVQVKIRKQTYSTAKSATVYLLTADENKTFDPSSDNSYQSTDIAFETDYGQEENMLTTFSNLESNTDYVIRIVVNYQDSDGAILTKTSNAQEPFTTLKQRAEFIYNGPIVLLQNPQTASLDTAIKANSIKDVDCGITKYIYTLYSYDDGVYTEVKQRTSETKDSIQFLLGGDIVRGQEYAVGLEIEFDDNEKTQLIEAPTKSNIASIVTATYPTVTFDLETVDEFNEIGGTLTIHNLNTDFDETSRIKVTYSIAGQYEKTVHYAQSPLEGEEAFAEFSDEEMKISVSLDGVKSGSQMYISVWGSYDIDLDGYYSEILVGTIVKDIVEPRVLSATWSVDEEGTNSLNALMYLSVLDDEGNAISTEEAKASTEAKTMGQMVIELYEGNNLSQPVGSMRYTNTSGDDKNSSFVDYFDSSTPVEINESTMNVAGINTSANYTLQVKEVTDYTVITSEENKSGYVNTLTVQQDSFTMEVNNLPPPLENSPINAVAILNSDARMYGGAIDENLEADTIVGFYLTTMYDNYAELAKSITYYAFDSATYDGFEPGTIKDPIEAGSNIAGINISLGTTNPTDLPGLVMFFGNDSEGNSNPNGESELGSLTNGSKVAYIGDKFDRGLRYIFAYQVEYEKNDTTYVYPNDYVDNYSMEDVLKTGVNNARKQEPEFSFIPWSSDDNHSYYYYIYEDVDKCIESEDMLWMVDGTDHDGSETIGSANEWNYVELGGDSRPLVEGSSTQVVITTKPFNYSDEEEEKTILIAPFETTQSNDFLDNIDIAMNTDFDNNRIYFNVVKIDNSSVTNLEMEEYLNRLAGLKIVFTRNGVTKEVYKDLYDVINYVPNWYTYTIVQTSEISSIIEETGDTTVVVYPIYDSGVSGFDIQTGELYALQKVKATSPFSFEEYQIRKDESWSIMDSINGSIFELDEYTRGDAVLGVNSVVGDENIPDISIEQDRYGVKGDGEEANTFMPKMLKLGDVVDDLQPITEDIQLTPTLVVYRGTDIQRYLDRITMDYRVQGQTSTTDIEFRIYEGSIENGQISYDSSYTTVTKEVNEAEGYVYNVEFSGLKEETYYKISAYAIITDSPNRLMLDGTRNKTDTIEYAEYETTTLAQTGITNITLDYVADTYNDKYYSLSYDLDTTLGFDIEYSIYDFDEEGNINSEAIYSHEDLISEGIIDELSDDYVYSENEEQEFIMFYDDYQDGEIWADLIKRDESKYRLMITAYSKNDRSLLGEAEVDFISHAPQSPYYYISSKPEYDSEADEYSLQIKVTVSDVSKVIAGYPYQTGYSGNGYYRIKIFKATENDDGDITYGDDVTPTDIKGKIYDIDRRRVFDLDNAEPNTGYMVNIYAVHDMDGTSDINIDDVAESELEIYKVATGIEYTLGSTNYSLGDYYASSQGSDETSIRVNFIDSTGLERITRIQYSYISYEGSISDGGTITDPTFIDRDDGVLSIDLDSEVIAGEMYYVSLKLFTEDDEEGQTISMTYDLD